MEEQKVCRRILQRLNTVDRSDFSEIGKIVKELLGKSEDAFINPPFYCALDLFERIYSYPVSSASNCNENTPMFHHHHALEGYSSDERIRLGHRGRNKREYI